jgi:hypothetical protein
MGTQKITMIGCRLTHGCTTLMAHWGWSNQKGQGGMTTPRGLVMVGLGLPFFFFFFRKIKKGSFENIIFTSIGILENLVEM